MSILNNLSDSSLEAIASLTIKGSKIYKGKREIATIERIPLYISEGIIRRYSLYDVTMNNNHIGMYDSPELTLLAIIGRI